MSYATDILVSVNVKHSMSHVQAAVSTPQLPFVAPHTRRRSAVPLLQTPPSHTDEAPASSFSKARSDQLHPTPSPKPPARTRHGSMTEWLSTSGIHATAPALSPSSASFAGVSGNPAAVQITQKRSQSHTQVSPFQRSVGCVDRRRSALVPVTSPPSGHGSAPLPVSLVSIGIH